MGATVPLQVTVNGEAHASEVPARMLLVHYLRDELGLTGTQHRLRHVQLRRLHVPRRRRIGQDLHGARRPVRRRGDHDDRGHGGSRRHAARAARGLLGRARPAVRLLHPRHDHGGRRPARPPHGRRADQRGRRSARAWRATSAAAPATTTSSRRSRPRPRPPGGSRHDDDRRSAHQARRPVAAPQGGPAPHHGPRDLRRRPRAAGHAARRGRALARGARQGPLDRPVAGARAPRRQGRLHRRGHERPARPAADGLGAARRRGQDARALAARARPRAPRRRRRRARHRRRQVRRRRRRRRGGGRVRAAARRRRRRGGAEGRDPRPRVARHEQGPRVVDGRRRRHRAGARRLRRRRRAADRQPPHGGRGDGDARLHRRVPRRPADRLVLDAGAAPAAALLRRADGHQRGQGARHRARGRRRLRQQAADLRRGDDVRLGVAQARPAGEVDRDALGEHGGLPPRPRPGRLRAHGRDAGRQDHRLPREHHPGPRRLLRAADADDPGARRVRDDRLLRDPRRADRHHRRADEQVLHRRDPRSGPPGDDAHARGHDRPARQRAGDGPRRDAPQELHQGRAVPLRDAVRHHV